jgi:hypothetical protein
MERPVPSQTAHTTKPSPATARQLITAPTTSARNDPDEHPTTAHQLITAPTTSARNDPDEHPTTAHQLITAPTTSARNGPDGSSGPYKYPTGCARISSAVARSRRSAIGTGSRRNGP